MPFSPTAKFTGLIAAIDAVNAEDPRETVVGGAGRPYETVYAERMWEQLEALYPDAGELLRIAARAQHIRRWAIPRGDYPEGREGYNKWRTTLRAMHADTVGALMRDAGYSEEEAAKVGSYLRKEQLKKEPDSQALENVVDVVFLTYYWDEFIGKYAHYDDDKLVDIVGKTLRKMSSTGHNAALKLDLDDRTARIVGRALEREKKALEALAKHEVS
jgi:hypothetical protein